MCKLRQKLVELLLTICKLSSPTKVNTEAVHDAVDDEEAVLAAGES
jgi:hypothetical protein